MKPPSGHLPHLLFFVQTMERLRREGSGPPGRFNIPRELFLVREEDNAFWELVGLVVRGLPSLLLGGIRFRRQTAIREDLSRQSLVSRLSSPVREMGVDRTPQPPGLVEMMLLDARKSVVQWLKDSRAGQHQSVALIDPDDILFAFDFRLENPSRRRNRELVEAGARFIFRTSGGHVLSALTHHLSRKLHADTPFLALLEGTQHTATGDYPLPTLVIHRRFVPLAAPISVDATTWLLRSQAFHASHANSDYLLDPNLETYRRYRQREGTEREVEEQMSVGKAAG